MKLRKEVQRHEAMADPLIAHEQKRKLRAMHKAVKEIYKAPKYRR